MDELPIDEEEEGGAMAGAKMFSYLGFKSVRSLAQVFDAFCKGLCAYSVENGWQSEKKSKAGQYETCAHAFRIMWKARKIELEGARLGNFMLK